MQESGRMASKESDDEMLRLVQHNKFETNDDIDLNDMQGLNEKQSRWKSMLSVWDQRKTRLGLVGLLGGILFGYDLGIISAALLQLMTQFELSCIFKQLLVSCAMIGAFIGSLIGGYMLDLIGRRATLLVNGIAYVIGALLVTFAPAFWMLVWGRITTGLALAVATAGECVYISEMTDADNRGRLVALREMGGTIGFLISNAVSFLLIQAPFGWRIMFALPIVVLIFQLSVLYGLNESERYIVSVGKESLTLQKLKENEGNISGRFILGLGLVLFQQLTGQVNILYYTPYVIHAMGIESLPADVLISSSIGIVRALATLGALFMVDAIGRRKLLTLGPLLMITGAVLMSSAVLFDATPRNHDELRCSEDPNFGITPANQTQSQHALQMTTIYLSGAVIYIGSYSISFAPVVWIVLGEIYPTYFRGRAISAASAVNWSANWLMSFTFLTSLDGMGAPTLFGLYGVICVLAALFVYFFLPETRGRTLEDISEDFKLRQR